MKTNFLLLALLFNASALAMAEKPVPLFNGRDLSGWTGADYQIKDGVMIARGKILRSEREYSNYEFEFEFSLPAGGNNGIGIHYPGKGRASSVAMELQILDNSHPKYSKLKDSQYHGSLYKLQAAKRGFLNPVGEWNQQKITVNGPKMVVELNGTVILDANLDELAKKNPKHKGVKRRKGYICFCGHNSAVKFRKMSITELPDSTK